MPRQLHLSKTVMNATRSDRLFAALQRILPTRLLSTCVFHITQVRLRPFKNFLIGAFRRAYRIDLGEAQCKRANEYASFNAFFTRTLRADARPLAGDASTFVSPVDGTVSQRAAITDGRLIQAKGHTYSALELLGGNAEAASRFDRGDFCTIYLAPHNYHRIHMPIAGTLQAWSYIPGRLFSVNPSTARAMSNLFARNERLVAHFDTASGPMALVMVGALFVGSLETVWTGRVSPPHRREAQASHYQMIDPRHFGRGAELGRFNMGSTVILLTARGALNWRSTNASDWIVRMGEALAIATHHDA